MTQDQVLLFGLLVFVFVFLIWGRWRYDLVAFIALLAALLAGVVPKEDAFSGFGHPATVIIALVLIVSRGLSNSGVIELVARYLIDASRKLGSHIAIMSGLAGSLSAVMNNVAALALLMPVDMQAAKKAGRSPALSLMPLSFASILGGMITLSGTPPNIVVAEFRGDALGESYRMFDFAPVGLACAIVGVAYVALIGWRLLPRERQSADAGKDLFALADYIAEARVSEGSPVIGKRVRELDEDADKVDVEIIGLIREGRRLPGLARIAEIRAGDILMLEASPDSLEEALGALKLEYVGKGEGRLGEDDLLLSEMVVTEGSRLAGRSALSVRMLYRYRVALVGVSRQGKRFRDKVRALTLEPGDILLLLGAKDRLSDVTDRLGEGRASSRHLCGRDCCCEPRVDLPAHSPRLCCSALRAPQHCSHPRRIYIHRMARHRLVGFNDPDRWGPAIDGRDGADRRRHRRLVSRILAHRRPDLADYRDDDPVGCHEQHGDGCHRCADSNRDCGATGREPGPLSHGRGRSRFMCVSHPDWPQEQHADHGPWWLSIR